MQDSVNYAQLTPLSFLDRSVMVYPDKPAVIYNDTVYSWARYNDRINRLAAALQGVGLGVGDRVAVLSPNIPPMLDAKFGPMRIGAILVALNVRLSSREIAYILNHSGAKVLIFDSEFADTVRGLVDDVKVETYVQIVDEAPQADDIPGPEYEAWLAAAEATPTPTELISETDTICINYTSGTTGFPKGVVFHPRGAWVNAVGEALEMEMSWRSNYLWTLPMFHCNGWCFPWANAAVGATNVCLRKVVPEDIYRLIHERKITHMCAAPTVLTAMYSSPAAEGQDLSGLTIATAGAPPAPQVIRTIQGWERASITCTA